VQAVYRLHAVVLHEGNSPSSGHYTTLALHSDQWYKCSDATIVDLSTAEALATSGGVYLALYVAEGKVQTA